MIHKLTPTLFWDTDIHSLSEADHAGFIIQRVCMLGTWNDWILVQSFYGMDQIKRELLNARYLDKKTLNYFSIIFDIPKNEFRCYSFQQSSQNHWNY